jgi:AcrR family transcriptional regulator
MELPASIEAAWGIRESPGKGPKRGLSLGRIVDAAVTVASAEGLAAVSMSRVATELGAATMSLYRYVGAKGELLALMTDAAFSTLPRAAHPDEPWRSALSGWAREHLAVLRRHPWLLRIPVSGPPITPNLVVWFDRGLGALHSTGLPEGDKLGVLLLVNGFVRNSASLTADLRMAASAGGSVVVSATHSYALLLSRLADRDRFPAIGAALMAGAFDQAEDGDADFNFGLACILDGVACLVRERQRTRTKSTASAKGRARLGERGRRRGGKVQRG